MTAHVVTEIDRGVMTVRIHRPEKKNALTAAMYAALAQACTTAETDDAVRVVVITGAGDAFTAGNDIKDFLENPPTDSDAPVFRFMHALAHLGKPAIAAVNGVAVGIGTTLLLHCDFAFAVPTARFQLPFVNLALVPEFGSSRLLARLVGERRASELLMLGEAFDAQTALNYGLLNAVVAPEALAETAAAKAKALCAKPPAALRETKRLLRADLDETVACIEREALAFGTRLKSPEFAEAARAFLEKRAPDFSKFS
jgi:enoyl-CoA hydratase/carnithine racemase